MPIVRPFSVDEPIVQVSLDLTNIDEALAFADVAVRAGVDWLEAGTPLILGEGLHAVRALHERRPHGGQDSSFDARRHCAVYVSSGAHSFPHL